MFVHPVLFFRLQQQSLHILDQLAIGIFVRYRGLRRWTAPEVSERAL